jgi:hypothetical protein
MAALLMLLSGASAAADTSSSPHYRVTDTQFGSGSSQSCSASYCAQGSAGDTVAGRSSSDNYALQFGPNPTREPRLEVITLGGTQNLGVLDTDRTATATSSVKVRTYASNGYTIQISGPTPGQGTHEIAPMTTPSTSHEGAEQFGINLVKNNAPAIGANPEQVPKGKGTFGLPTDDYGVPDIFKYKDGDIIALSDAPDGETHYTMSMILNVSSGTPLGRYTGNFSVIVIPGY